MLSNRHDRAMFEVVDEVIQIGKQYACLAVGPAGRSTAE
jgi:hypothetical protein